MVPQIVGPFLKIEQDYQTFVDHDDPLMLQMQVWAFPLHSFHVAAWLLAIQGHVLHIILSFIVFNKHITARIGFTSPNADCISKYVAIQTANAAWPQCLPENKIVLLKHSSACFSLMDKKNKINFKLKEKTLINEKWT